MALLRFLVSSDRVSIPRPEAPEGAKKHVGTVVVERARADLRLRGLANVRPGAHLRRMVSPPCGDPVGAYSEGWRRGDATHESEDLHGLVMVRTIVLPIVWVLLLKLNFERKKERRELCHGGGSDG